MESWTSRLHRELGLPASAFSYQMIETAIETRLGEFEDLDWKRVLPGKSDHELEEFAKDVAAMANTVGGILVFGIAEERGTGSATEVVPVDISETTQRRLRALAASCVHPFVTGLRILTLPSTDDPSQGVLIVIVPESSDAPHAVGTDYLGIPVRHESDTRWMAERELASAYRNRFEREGAGTRRLEGLLADVMTRIDLTEHSWLVAAVIPRSLRRPIIRPDRWEPVQVIKGAWGLLKDWPGQTHGQWFQILKQLDPDSLRPKRGLRRWVADTPSFASDDPRSSRVHFEYHDDGALTFAAATEGWYRGEIDDAHAVPFDIVESFAAELVALVLAKGQQSVTDMTTVFAVSIITGADSRTLALVEPQRSRIGALSTVYGSRRVLDFLPVLSEVDHVLSTEDALLTAASISRDIVNQFGIDQSESLPDPFSPAP